MLRGPAPDLRFIDSTVVRGKEVKVGLWTLGAASEEAAPAFRRGGAEGGGRRSRAHPRGRAAPVATHRLIRMYQPRPGVLTVAVSTLTEIDAMTEEPQSGMLAPLPHLPCELYQAWEAARDTAQMAYAEWCVVPPPLKGDAYVAYRAAADREDVAARRFMEAAERVDAELAQPASSVAVAR